MQRFPTYLGMMLLAIAPLASAVPDENGVISEPGAAAAGVADDAQMSARLNYNVGFEEFEKTQKLALGGAGLKGAALRAHEAELRKGFTAARERFRAAAAADPAMKEAWNLIGYTSRKLGDYEASLTAYDTALKLAPEYPEAIEYRAELFLLTGRFEDVKSAYAWLLNAQPSYAQVLKTAMHDWAASKDAPGAKAPGRDAFVAWVGTL